MKARGLWILAIVVAAVAGPAAAHGQTPVGTAFTYQGQLKLLGEPLDDTADFEFTLWDAPIGGNQVGPMVPVNNEGVVGGLFTVALDFGVAPFTTNEARWLEIAVRSPSGSGDFTTLDPRQALTPTAFSLATRGINVDAIGKVGVGTTEPAYPLDVDGIIRTTGGIRFPDGSEQYSAASSPPVGPPGVQEFIEPGDHTWKVPDGVYRVMLELWGGSGGGGGGGGGAHSPGDPNNPYVPAGGGGGGGGGGAGGYVRTFLSVTPGQTYIVRIGSAGTGGSGGGIGAGGGDGEDGTLSQFMEADYDVLATTAGGLRGHGGGGGSSSSPGYGGAGGAGGGVDPVEGIARPGTDGADGFSGGAMDTVSLPGGGGPPGMAVASASVSPPPPEGVFCCCGPPRAPMGGAGGAGGTGEYYYGAPGPFPGVDGQPGYAGYAVLQW